VSDVTRIRNDLQIQRRKLKLNLLNEARIKACLSRFDNGSYTRLQFLRAVSHAVGAHTESLQPSPDSDSSDEDEDTLQAPTTSGSSSAAATVASATDNTAP